MKWYLHSKTVIANLLFLAVTSYEMYSQFIQMIFGQVGYAVFMTLMIIVNLYLRKVTDKPLTFTKAKSDASGT